MNNVERALAAIARGEMVLVVDDPGRENEGDLIMAAEKATPETLAFMIRHTSGVICAALRAADLDRLRLPLMVADNSEHQRTAFTVTVDARHGTTTGVSAADRAATLQILADPSAAPEDLVRPGHVFPLRAAERGVLERRGHTEAAVDLARLAGLSPCGVLSEVMNDDGSMARPAELAAFASRHDLVMIEIGELVAHRRRTEPLVTVVSDARLPTRHGEFQTRVYRDHAGHEHVALVMGDMRGCADVLVRVHSECPTGDIFGSLRCDCGEQLEAAMARVAVEGRGVVVYLRGLPLNARSYDVGAQILTDLGVTTLRLMSNHPAKFVQLEGYDLRIVGRVPLLVPPNQENIAYLKTKQLELGHQLEIV